MAAVHAGGVQPGVIVAGGHAQGAQLGTTYPAPHVPGATHGPGHGASHVHVGGAGVVVGGGHGQAAGGGGGAAGGACDTCCVGYLGGGEGPASMTFVGGGQGSYVAETTYKFVGHGGEFNLVKPKTNNMIPYVVCAMLLLLAALAVLAIAFLPDAATTTPKTTGSAGSCLIWGDPHMKTFDQTFVDEFDEGEFWIVKTPTVSIQGRFLATEYTNGLAATHTIAIGGPFLEDHTLMVGPMEGGQITWDGNPIMTTQPSTFSQPGLVEASYNGEGKLVDDANGNLDKHIVHLDLPLGIHMQIMRWGNYVNADVTMAPRADGQDGVCGNFNNNPDDDTAEAIKARLGRIPRDQLLFKTRAPVGPAGVHKTIADCPLEQRNRARGECMAKQPEAKGVLLEDCIFDVCFGGDQFAAEDGVAESNA